jgi:phosphoglycerate dehydrogenase-like enzyme
MSSSSLLLLVIAEGAPLVSALSALPAGVRAVITAAPDELRATAPAADAILFAHVNPDLLIDILPLARRARWIHSLWTGVEGILKPAMLQHPATLTNGRGVFRGPLSDWVAAVMLFFAFDLRRVIQQQERGVWEPFIGTTLSGTTLGIVGYGEIGRAAAERARAFGMKIAALRRRSELLESDARVDQGFGPEQLRALMAASDYVLLAMPLTAETRGMVGASEIAAMKSTGVLINIGRGPVVDESALIRALQKRAIRGAALDVFDTEPLPTDHPFWKMSNVLLSPHTADRVEGFLGPAFECFYENLSRFQKGDPLLNIVSKEAGY